MGSQSEAFCYKTVSKSFFLLKFKLFVIVVLYRYSFQNVKFASFKMEK